MQVEEVDLGIEKQILIAMITSDKYLTRIFPIFDLDYIDFPITKRICSWVTEYFATYGSAPKSMMEGLFESHAGALRVEDKQWVADFLNEVSNYYSKNPINVEFLFDVSVKYFRRQRLLRSSDRVKKLLEKNRLDEAEQLWLTSRTLPMVNDDMGIDPLSIKDAEQLFKSNDLRVFVNTGIIHLDQLIGKIYSGWLVVVLGPQKRGKTWTFIHMARSMVLEGKNVVFISLESPVEEMTERFWMNMSSLSSENNKKLQFPYYYNYDLGKIKYRDVDRPFVGSLKEVRRAIRKSRKLYDGQVRIKCFPMKTAGLREIENYLDMLSVYQNFNPDVVIVDYLGIMKQPNGIKRDDAYDENSAGLKALAQKRKCVVITGHQGQRSSLDALNIESTNTSQDIRIIGNLDILIGLNQTEDEMDKGVMRLSMLLHRHKKRFAKLQVQLLQQLSAGQFALDGKFIDKPLNGTSDMMSAVMGMSDGDEPESLQ